MPWGLIVIESYSWTLTQRSIKIFPSLHSAQISEEVTGKRRHCSEAGGMEIPCTFLITLIQGAKEKRKHLIEDLNSSSVVILATLSLHLVLSCQPDKY